MRISDWSSDVCSSDLVAFNHRTPIDHFMIAPVLPRAVSYVALANNGRVFGSFLQYFDAIQVDRDNDSSEHIGRTRQFYKEANSVLQAGRLVVMNTEGTYRSEEHTSELQYIMRISNAVFS